MSRLSDVTRRSLSNLSATLQRAQQGGTLHELDLDAVLVVSNVRGVIDLSSDEFVDFVESVRVHGVQQPVLVRPSRKQPGRFELIAGERRWRASRAAGRKTLPAIVKHVSDAEVLDIQLLENYQRENLTLLQEAQALRRMLDEEGSLEKVARKWQQATRRRSVSKSWVSERLQLLELGPAARRLIEDNVTADLAVINSVNRVERLDPAAARELAAQVRVSERKREVARSGLDQVKGRVAAGKGRQASKARAGEAARFAAASGASGADGCAGGSPPAPVARAGRLEAAHAAGARLAGGGPPELAATVESLAGLLEDEGGAAPPPAERRLLLRAFALGVVGQPCEIGALLPS